MDEKTAQAVLNLVTGLDAVSAARISGDGHLVGAQGFLAGMLPEGDVCACFREPTWAQLSATAQAGESLPIHRGPLALAGSGAGEPRLNASLWRAEAGFLLLAERPAPDIEHLSKATVRLANELATARRELDEASSALLERERQVQVMTSVDGITGLGNQRAFNQSLATEVIRAGRYGGPLCLVLAAIDGLEGIAGHFGSDAVDDVLRCFAHAVCNETRKSDQACRVGDNRFMLLLTHTPPERAAAVTDRIRLAFAAASPGMVATTVTASFGHADWRAGDDAGSLIERVESALRSASAAGGDRIVAA